MTPTDVVFVVVLIAIGAVLCWAIAGALLDHPFEEEDPEHEH